MFGLSKRWEMVLLLLSGVVIVYTLRVNMSVAAQDMRDELDWSENEKGLVLSAFYWGYAAGQLPASRLCQIYGAKWIFGLSVLIPSILTLLVPVACRFSFVAALMVRMMIGFFESASFPCLYHFFPIWLPNAEKTFLIPVLGSGMYIGTIIGFSLSGVMTKSVIFVGGMDLGGWPSVFYAFGSVGVLWFPLFAICAHESPDVHPTITQEEKAFIQEGKQKLSKKGRKGMGDTETGNSISSPLLGGSGDDSLVAVSRLATRTDPVVEATRLNAAHHNKIEADYAPIEFNYNNHEDGEEELDSLEHAQRTPWIHFVTHPAGITLIINNFCFGWIGFLLLSEMPAYLEDVLGFSLEMAGVLCIFPYVAMFISVIFFGKLFVWLQAEKGMATRTVRQYAEFLALGGAAGGLLVVGCLSNRWAAYSFFIISQLAMGAIQSGLACAFSDAAPAYSSSLNSLANTCGAVAGICGPLIVGYFTTMFPQNNGIWGWRIAFMITGCFAVISLITWSRYQSSDIVPAINNPLPKRA